MCGFYLLKRTWRLAYRGIGQNDSNPQHGGQDSGEQRAVNDTGGGVRLFGMRVLRRPPCGGKAKGRLIIHESTSPCRMGWLGEAASAFI